MQVVQTRIAKLYAQAFLNLEKGAFNTDHLKTCRSFSTFLKENRSLHVALRIPRLSLLFKRELLDTVALHFNLKSSLKKLIHVILSSGRIEILHHIFDALEYEYYLRHNIQLFTITSSHALTALQQEVIIEKINSLTHSTIVPHFLIDQQLIVGVRAQSSTSLWEWSINKELKKISTLTAQKGISC